jgi:hypothetical protein
MDKDTALKLALHALGNAEQLTPSVSLIAQCREAITAIKQALAAHPPQRTEQNFCSRCGKRTPDLITIHTCTPPQD